MAHSWSKFPVIFSSYPSQECWYASSCDANASYAYLGREVDVIIVVSLCIDTQWGCLLPFCEREAAAYIFVIDYEELTIVLCSRSSAATGRGRTKMPERDSSPPAAPTT